MIEIFDNLGTLMIVTFYFRYMNFVLQIRLSMESVTDNTIRTCIVSFDSPRMSHGAPRPIRRPAPCTNRLPSFLFFVELFLWLWSHYCLEIGYWFADWLGCYPRTTHCAAYIIRTVTRKVYFTFFIHEWLHSYNRTIAAATNRSLGMLFVAVMSCNDKIWNADRQLLFSHVIILFL